MGHDQQEFICQKLESLAPDILCYKTTWAGLAPRLEPSSAVMLLVVPHVSGIIHVSALQSRGRTCLTVYHTCLSLTKCHTVSLPRLSGDWPGLTQSLLLLAPL